MKILIFNQDWFAAELRQLGHEVITCGFEPHLDHKIVCGTFHLSSVLNELKDFTPDVILWLDNSVGTFLMTGLESCSIPAVFYSVDTFHHRAVHGYIAPLFDHILVAQKDYLSVFDESQTPTTWLPLWAPRHVEPSNDKRWFSTFVGTLDPKLNPRRVKFFDALQKKIDIHITQGKYWEIFPFSEIVVNQTVKQDLNFRVFEAMMSGVMLLTERTPNGLFDLFRDGEHFITYTPDDVDDAAQKVIELSRDPSRMRKIARSGREAVLQKHTAMARARALEPILATLTKRIPPEDRHFISMVNSAMTSDSMKRHFGAHCLVSLTSSIISATQALAADEPMSALQLQYLIRTCLNYDAVSVTQAGDQLLRAFSARMQDNKVLALATIRGHLNAGRTIEAEHLAATISSASPTEVFKLAEHAIETLLSPVSEQLPKQTIF